MGDGRVGISGERAGCAAGAPADPAERCAACRFSVLRPWTQGMGETLAEYREREAAARARRRSR